MGVRRRREHDRTFECCAKRRWRYMIKAVSLFAQFRHQAALSAAPRSLDRDAVFAHVRRLAGFARRGGEVGGAVSSRGNDSSTRFDERKRRVRVLGPVTTCSIRDRPRSRPCGFRPTPGDFCLMSRRVVEQLKAAPERHRVFARVAHLGRFFRRIWIPSSAMTAPPGESKSNFRRLGHWPSTASSPSR